MAEIVADVVAGRAAEGGIVGEAGAVDVPVAVAGGIADVAGPAGEGTRTFCHGFSRIYTDRPKATARVVAFLSSAVLEGFMYEVILKRFEQPDEVRTFEKGKFELVHVGGMTIGRATYQPGWKWSLHVGKAAGAKSCMVEHVGMVVSGRATAAMDDGRVIEMKAGDVFFIEPGHDSWVVGDEPYVSLHFMGANEYAQQKK